MEQTLFAMCLPTALSKAQVESLVGRCGRVLSCRLLWSPGGNMARVKMASREDVDTAVNLLSGSTIDGHIIYACAGHSELGEELELPFASSVDAATADTSAPVRRGQVLAKGAS